MTDLDIALFDANSYYASCHQAVDPTLRGKPVLVAGDPGKRTGIILTASYEARLHGVKTTMPVRHALALCPEAVLIQPDFPLYLTLSEKMWQIVGRYTDRIEVVSVDECYADFLGSHLLFGPSTNIAQRIQTEIWEELRLGVSVGLSYCKVMAKIGSQYARDPATGVKHRRSFTKISDEDVAAIIWTMRVEEIPGVGRALQSRLNGIGIYSIGDLAHYPAEELFRQIGTVGLKFQQWANGKDPRPVRAGTEQTQRSLGRSVTLPEDISEPEQVNQVLLALADSIGRRLRHQKARTQVITLTVRNSDFLTYTFSTTLDRPTDHAKDIFRECCQLHQDKWTKGAIRLLGISVSLLHSDSEQLSLFNERENLERKLDETVDTLRERYGSQSVLRAAQLLAPTGKE